MFSKILFAAAMILVFGSAQAQTNPDECSQKVPLKLAELLADVHGDQPVVTFENGKFKVNTSAPGFVAFDKKDGKTYVKVKVKGAEAPPPEETNKKKVVASAAHADLTFEVTPDRIDMQIKHPLAPAKAGGKGVLQEKPSPTNPKDKKFSFRRVDSRCFLAEEDAEIPTEHLINTPGKIEATEGHRQGTK